MTAVIEWRRDGDDWLLPIKAVPGASRTRYGGEWAGRAKIAVAAPAEAGKANKAIIAFLAERFGVRKTAVRIESGATAPLKMIRIVAPGEDDLPSKLKC